MWHFRWIFLLLLAMNSCSSQPTTTESTIPLDDSVVTSPDSLPRGVILSGRTSVLTGRSYACYLPASNTQGEKSPVLLLLDPHADALLPLTRYRSLADKYGFLLVASGDVQNGLSLEESSRMVGDLLEEIRTRLPGDANGISLIGFSGAAKAAMAATSQVANILSVVYCGAAFPPGSFLPPVPSLGITGLQDMNMSEVIYYYTSMDSSNLSHSLYLHRGKHEWPEPDDFEAAVAWCLAQQCRLTGSCDTASLRTLQARSLSGIDVESDLVLKNIRLQNHVITFKKLFDTQPTESELIRLQQSSAFRSADQAFGASLNREMQERAMIQDALVQRDLAWWDNQIRTWRRAGHDPVNERLLSYVSLACYGYSRSSLLSVRLDEADHYLSLYQKADPKNSEWAFLRACYYAQKGMRNEAVNSLKESVRLGLKDPNKIRTEKILGNLIQDAEVAALIQGLDD